MAQSRLFGGLLACLFGFVSIPCHAELVDNGGGLIYDTVLDITWAQERSVNRMNWEEANTYAAGLTLGGVGGWRLPYISVVEGAGPFPVGPAVECDQTSEEACRDNETGYMFYQNLSGTRSDPVTGSGDPDLDLFPTLLPDDYWTGTDSTGIGGDPSAWSFRFQDGISDPNNSQVGNTAFVWAVHDGNVGGQPLQTFDDVPPEYWAYTFIETLAASGITGGCDSNNYCPTDQVTRAQMAVFLERGINGSDFEPAPATGMVFNDVAANDFAAEFIERLFSDGITGGCGNSNYCPEDAVKRDEMAVFLLRAKYGSAYVPPPATGLFADVPLGFWAVDWIEQLSREGITSGCGGGNYCPGDPVNRDQMAVFLVRTFGL